MSLFESLRLSYKKDQITPDRKAPWMKPASLREHIFWLAGTGLSLAVVIGGFYSLPDAEKQKNLMSYYPIPHPTSTPLPTPILAPAQMSLFPYAKPTETPSVIRINSGG